MIFLKARSASCLNAAGKSLHGAFVVLGKLTARKLLVGVVQLRANRLEVLPLCKRIQRILQNLSRTLVRTGLKALADELFNLRCQWRIHWPVVLFY
jgi:hypothetical protein